MKRHGIAPWNVTLQPAGASRLGDFYRKSEADLYVNPLDFHVMSDKDLAQHIAAGIRLYNSLYPPDKGLNPLMVIAVVVVAVAAVAAVAAAGSAAAGGAAATGAGASAASTGIAAASPGLTSVGSMLGTSSTSVLSAVQNVAGYVSTAGKVYSSVTGKNPPEKLMAAADVVGSGSVSGAVKSAVGYQLKQEGLEIAKDDKKAQMALDVMIQREQEKYSAQLRKLSEQEAARLHVPVPEPAPQPAPFSARDVIGFGLPIVLFLLGRG